VSLGRFQNYNLLETNNFRHHGVEDELEELGRRCADLDPTIGTFADKAAPLTEYAWRFRYPGDSDEPLPEEAKAALATAREVYDAIVNRVPARARP
jgi:hypothetical protein